MQEKEFKDILQKHAGQFSIQPSFDKFSGTMEARERAKNERRRRKGVFLLVASVTIIVGSILIFIPGRENKALQPEQKRLSTIATKEVEDGKGRDSHKDQKEILGHKGENTLTLLNQSSGHKGNKSSNHVITPKTVVGKAPINRQEINRGKAFNRTVDAKSLNNKNGSKPIIKQVDETNGINEPGLALVATTNLVSDTVAVSQSKEQRVIAAIADTSKSIPDSNTASVSVPPLPASKTDPEKPKWIASFVFTPQVVNSVYSANSDADLSWLNNYLDNKKENDQARFCYNAGIRLERMIGDRFSIGTGVFLSVIKFEELKVVNQMPPVVNFDSQVSVATAYEEGTIEVVDRNRYDISFTSLEVPLMINYTIPVKKFEIKLSSGVAYSYLVETRSLVFDKLDSLNVRETNDAGNKRLQHHNLMLVAGLTAGYRINSSWGLYMGPMARFAMQSLYSKDYVIKQKPYFVGLETGIQFHF